MGAAGPGTAGESSWTVRRRRLVVGALAIVFLVAALVAAVSWHYSSEALVPHHRDWPEDVTVERLAPGRIVLERTEDSRRPGVYGLVWQGGDAIVGPPLAIGGETVTRRLRRLRGYLAPGMEVAIDLEVYSGDPRQTLGLDYADVPVPGELGPMPAWLIPGRGDTWALLVHGINGFPEAGLRIVPALRRAGVTSLLITYREDLGAPSSPDGLHHMGLTEWRDLEAAARFALAHGARRLLLVGYSMGGSIVTQFMQKSALAHRAAGLVLDAPALDWREILSFRASEMGMPGFAAKPVEWAIGARIDADWESLDAAAHPEALDVPILLFHGGDDDVVPISTSEELAAELPGRVTFYRVPRAAHTAAWNVDPSLYERRLRRFLRRIGA